MKTLHRIITATLILLILGLNLLKADSAGEIGAETLTMIVDSKAKSMGEAYSALGDGISSIQYNPAGLSRLDTIEIGVTHLEWIADLQYEYFGLGMPLTFGTVGASFLILHQPSFMETSKGFETGAEIGAYDYILTGSYGIEVYEGLALGSSFKFCKRKLAEFDNEIFAFDVGAMYSLRLLDLGPDLPYSKNLSFSLVGKNLGFSSKMSTQDEKLPYDILFGTALTPYKYFTLAFDMEKINKRDLFFKVGLDIMPGWYFSPRVGINTGNDLSILTAGAGTKIKTSRMIFQVDYAVDPLNILGINHCFSLSIKQAAGRLEDLMKKQRFRREDVSYLVFLNLFNKSKSAEYAYLSSSIPESFAKNLNKLDYIIVRSTGQMSSSEKKKIATLSQSKETQDIINFGRDLNVNGVVTGVYTIEEDILTISIQLVDVMSRTVVYSEEKSCNMTSYIQYSRMLDEITIQLSREAEKMIK